MFPGPYAEVVYNEAGEPLGWENHYYDEPPEPSEDDERRWDMESSMAEDVSYTLTDDLGWSDEKAEKFSQWYFHRQRYSRFTSLEAAIATWEEIGE